ncbi:hypothetical protein E2C01_034441 [Portunus trituberculatus]|uniref:Uncharacterized protein n=1 Tax=Portunus trituberculatus TaxID=210409 RepID=A0A5B7F6Z3_PORTR|nr:hypothetical protein [Portunus trituberculatus]
MYSCRTSCILASGDSEMGPACPCFFVHASEWWQAHVCPGTSGSCREQREDPIDSKPECDQVYCEAVVELNGEQHYWLRF